MFAGIFLCQSICDQVLACKLEVQGSKLQVLASCQSDRYRALHVHQVRFCFRLLSTEERHQNQEQGFVWNQTHEAKPMFANGVV